MKPYVAEGYCSVHGKDLFPAHAECASRPVKFITYCTVHGSQFIPGHPECDRSYSAALFDYFGNFPRISVKVVPTGTAVVGGTGEADIRTGSQTIILTLTNATWVASTPFNALRQAFLDGISSISSGWATVEAEQGVANVVRTSATIATITLPAASGYAIDAAEVVNIRIPAAAITEFAAVNASPAVTGVYLDVIGGRFVVTPVAVTAALTGTFLTTPTEAEVVTGGQTIIITLSEDTWVASGATFNAIRQDIIDGLTSDGVEETGWNTLVRDVIAVTTVARTSNTIVTVTLPAIGSYAIDAAEEVTVTIPASALTYSTTPVVATQTIDIQTSA